MKPYTSDPVTSYKDEQSCETLYSNDPERPGTRYKESWGKGQAMKKLIESKTLATPHMGDECYTRPELCGDEGFTIRFTTTGTFLLVRVLLYVLPPLVSLWL